MSVQLLRRLLVVLSLTTLALLPHTSIGQDQETTKDHSQVAAERFLQILLKRPQEGTSLDRVFDFHVREGSLDQLLTALEGSNGSTLTGIVLPPSEPGAAAMTAGLLQLRRGRLKEAIRDLEAAEELRPNDAVCSYQLGKALLAAGDTSAAAEAMERAIQRQPPRNVALPIFRDLGRLYSRAGQTTKAVQVWSKLEALFPDDSRIGSQIARAFADDGHFEEALKRYEELGKSARKDDDKVTFAIQAAEMKRRLGDEGEANQDLENILRRLRPGSWLSKSVRNRIEDGFLANADVEGLVAYYREKVKETPDDLNLILRLTRVLMSANQLAEAAEFLNQAIQRAPDAADLRLTIIDVLRRMQKEAEAIRHSRYLAEKDPGNPDYVLAWGDLVLAFGEGEQHKREAQAAEIWQRLGNAHSEDSVTLAIVADRLRSLQHSEAALDRYRDASKASPNATQYRESLGDYLYQLGRKQEAIEVYESIAAGSRRQAETLIRLAEIYQSLKLEQRSLNAWRLASEFDLTFNQELRYVERLRTARQYQEAHLHLDRARQLAEEPNEKEELIAQRIQTWSAAGKLPERIAHLEKQVDADADGSQPDTLKELALLYEATGQPSSAILAISEATKRAPNDAAVLAIAARLYEEQKQYQKAAKSFRRLADINRQTRMQSLRKVATLQMQALDSDLALKACDDLIAANPSSVDTYLFSADIAMKMGRQDEGLQMLRRASRVAPRDTRPLIRLASQHEREFQNERAIDVYWQAMGLEQKLEEKVSIIIRLAKLYQAESRTADLLDKIRRFATRESDLKAIGLMQVAAYEAIEDRNAARIQLEQLLARYPRAPDLLKKMVDLCAQMEDSAAAVQYQQRIATLTPSPEADEVLLQLKLAAGQIDIGSVFRQKMEKTEDSRELLSVVKAAQSQADPETAIQLAKTALQRHPQLWDVKRELIVLLMQKNDEQSVNDARRLCSEIVDLDLPPETPAPSLTDSDKQQLKIILRMTLSERIWSRLAEHLKMPTRYAHNGPEFASALPVMCYGDAWVDATRADHLLIRSQDIAARGKLTLPARIDDRFVLPEDLSEVSNPWDIIRRQAFLQLKASVRRTRPLPFPNVSIRTFRASGIMQMRPAGAPQFVSFDRSFDDRALRLTPASWRLFELEPKEAFRDVCAHLKARYWNEFPSGFILSINRLSSENRLPNKPLELKHLESVASYVSLLNADPATPFEDVYSPAIQLQYEFELAGQTQKSSALDSITNLENATLSQLATAIAYHAEFNDQTKLKPLVARLEAALRRQIAGAKGLGLIKAKQISEPIERLPLDLLSAHRLALLNAVVAADVFRRSLPTYQSNSTVFHRSSSRYPGIAVSGSYYNPEDFMQPLSASLFDLETVAALRSLCPEIMALAPPSGISFSSSYRVESPVRAKEQRKKLLEQVASHLLKPVPNASQAEDITRRSLAAYVRLLNKDQDKAFEILSQLNNDYPKNADVRLELARRASELKRHDVVLRVLGDPSLVAPQHRVRAETFVLTAATAVGDRKQIAAAAERLANMSLTPQDGIGMVYQLRTTSEKTAAIRILDRIRPSVVGNPQTLMQVASLYRDLEDTESANEIARRQIQLALNNPPSSLRTSPRNTDILNQQAIGILESTEALHTMIDEMKQRVDAAPSSFKDAEKLSRLFEMAKMVDASKDFHRSLLERRTDFNSVGQIGLGKRLLMLGQYELAGEILISISRDAPERIKDLQEALVQVSRSGQRTKVLDALTEIPSHQLPSDMLLELLRIQQRTHTKKFRYSELTSSERTLVHVLLQKPYEASWGLKMLNTLPESERRQLPEYRAAVMNVVRYCDLFSGKAAIWGIRRPDEGESPLAQLLRLAAKDEEVRQHLGQRTKNVYAGFTSQGTAALLQALVDLSFALESSGAGDAHPAATRLLAAVNRMRPVEEAGFELESKPEQFSDEFIQQMVRFVRETETIPMQVELIIAVDAVRPVQISPRSNSFDQTILPDILATFRRHGREDLVRERLLLTDAQDAAPGDVKYAPTLWDNYLKRKLWIADELLMSDAAPETIRICRQLVAATANQVNYRRLYKGKTLRRIRALEQAAVRKLTPENSIAYLHRLKEQLANAEHQPPSLNVILTEPSEFHSSDSWPLFQLICFSAARKEAGRDAIKAVDELIGERTNRFPNSLSPLVARLVIASVLRTQQQQEFAGAIQEKLAQMRSNVTSDSKPEMNATAPLFATLLALANHDESNRQTIQQLLDQTVRLVREQRNIGAELVLRERFDFIEPINVGHVAKTVDGEILLNDFPLFVEILKRASDAAIEGRQVAAARTLSFALQSQPASMDDWLFDASRPPGASQEKKEARRYFESVLTALNSSAPQQQADDASGREPLEETARQLVDALLPVVFAGPDTQPRLYAATIVPSSGRNLVDVNFTKTGFEPPVSVSETLIQLAAKCGRLKEIEDHITGDGLRSDLLRIQLARQRADKAILAKQLSAFTNRLMTDFDRFTASIQSLNVADEQLIEHQAQQMSARKSRFINHLLLAAWDTSSKGDEPTSMNEGKSAVAEANLALELVVDIIDSDSHTSDRLNRISRIVQNQLHRNPED